MGRATEVDIDTVVCVGMDVMYVCKYAGAAGPFLCRGSLTPHFLSQAGNHSVSSHYFSRAT